MLDLLGREESPERVAAAIAMGIAVGFSPFIGFHIWIALGLAFVFRLNKIDAALGQFAGNPWTLPAVYAFGYRLGRWILDYDRRSVPRLAWDRLLHSDFWHAFKGAGLRAASALVPRRHDRHRGRHRAGGLRVLLPRDPSGSITAAIPRVAIRAAQRRNTGTLRAQQHPRRSAPPRSRPVRLT